MLDFTVAMYQNLLAVLIDKNYLVLSFSDALQSTERASIILRHDVDRAPVNSMVFSDIQSDLGIKGTYYFRICNNSFQEEMINRIAVNGHEIGYHYEDVSLAAERHRAQGTGRRANKSKKYLVGSMEYEEFERELVDIAIKSFAENLEKLRKIAPVKTICMHGSPMSRWDNRLLWKYYDYHDFGIIGEPYFDMDFNEVLYLTDTGRRWDGGNVTIRDKAQGPGLRAQGENPYKDWKVKPFKYRQMTQDTEPWTQHPGPGTQKLATSNQQPAASYKFHSTSDIIKTSNERRLPDKIMMTFHPQRWTNRPVPWLQELIWQNLKNFSKFLLIKTREGK